MPEYLPLVVALVSAVSGIAIGAGAVWLYLQRETSRALDQGKRDGEAERAVLAARLGDQEQRISELKQAIQQKDSVIDGQQTTVTTLNARAAQLQTALQEQAKQAEEKLAAIEQAEQKLADTFKALATHALASNNEAFLQLAQTKLETFQTMAVGDLQKRQLAIDQLVQPIKQSLAAFDNTIHGLESARTSAYEELKNQVRSLVITEDQLRKETSILVRALHTPIHRALWGQLQLKRVVELAGMLNCCDFYEQTTVDTEQGQLRPDMLVRLPGNKTIVVDAKTPLDAYWDAMAADDDDSRKENLKSHARRIRQHMSDLARKSYWEQFQPGPEFVVMFLPAESYFSAALQCEPTLIEVGAEQGIIIATPTTLISLLRAVSYGWRHEALAQNAREISKLGLELYDRISRVCEHVGKLGANLKTCVDAYNAAIGSLESRVLVSARKFRDLGAAAGRDEIQELLPIEVSPRPLQAPELLIPWGNGENQTQPPAD